MELPAPQAIAEIDRRLNQERLTALDRAQLIASRKEIWQRLHSTCESAKPPDPEPGENA